jgi:hypothetical protein
VTKCICRFQKDFLDHGINHLKPMVLRNVAEEIDMHESTVSRATTNKWVHTPQGIFELKFFFNSPINTTNGESVASESVKEHIRKIIKSEDPRKPYSDLDIVEMLNKMGIEAARRTVAKYRESMGIQTSRRRRLIPPGLSTVLRPGEVSDTCDECSFFKNRTETRKSISATMEIGQTALAFRFHQEYLNIFSIRRFHY